jgi:hypothetical protein
MPSLDCPRCNGSGYTENEAGDTTIVCTRCEETIAAAMVKADAGACPSLD